MQLKRRGQKWWLHIRISLDVVGEYGEPIVWRKLNTTNYGQHGRNVELRELRGYFASLGADFPSYWLRMVLDRAVSPSGGTESSARNPPS